MPEFDEEQDYGVSVDLGDEVLTITPTAIVSAPAPDPLPAASMRKIIAAGHNSIARKERIVQAIVEVEKFKEARKMILAQEREYVNRVIVGELRMPRSAFNFACRLWAMMAAEPPDEESAIMEVYNALDEASTSGKLAEQRELAKLVNGAKQEDG